MNYVYVTATPFSKLLPLDVAETLRPQNDATYNIPAPSQYRGVVTVFGVTAGTISNTIIIYISAEEHRVILH